MNCRAAIEVYNLPVNFQSGVPAGVAPFPHLQLLATMQPVPYPMGIVGFMLSGAYLAVALGNLSLHVIIGQNVQQLEMSQSIRCIASQGVWQRTPRSDALADGVVFKKCAYPLAANEPISIYGAKAATNDFVVGLLSVYVVRAA